MSVLLTTWPLHRSGNVGDALITASTVALIRERFPAYAPQILFREEELEAHGIRPVITIVAPGFSVAEGFYPKLYRLYSDLDKLDCFYPVGCSIQTNPRAAAPWDDVTYSPPTLETLRLLNSKFGSFPCRDELIVEILQRHELAAFNIGDMALYDSRHIEKPLQVAQNPKSIVFTLGHHQEYREQALELLGNLVACFPEAKVTVAFHGRPSGYSTQVAAAATSLGCSIVDLHGEASNLNFYDGIDLHVGYRLHGHIAFLRRRKPSLLLMEDVRSFGFSKNPGANATVIAAFKGRPLQSDTNVHNKALELLRYHLDHGFRAYETFLNWVDLTFLDFVVPYFNNLARNLMLENLRGSKPISGIARTLSS